ncbi:DUF1752 family protein [Pseudohyphozyma bogoriensis]|nr:DUF1752 family protein [Pseudohyphozyma bogoriensis]
MERKPRLENLSWRLWFDSSRREAKSHSQAAIAGVADYEEAGWSDPEWTETTDSESESDDEPAAKSGRTDLRRSLSSAAAATTTPSTTAKPDDAKPAAPPTIRANSSCHTSRPSFERKGSATITGGSLQRIITGLTELPALSAPSKARSAIDVPVPSTTTCLHAVPSPSLAPRGASAPSVCDSTVPDAATSHLPPAKTTSPTIVPAAPRSPALSRQLSTGSRHASTSKAPALARAPSSQSSKKAATARPTPPPVAASTTPRAADHPTKVFAAGLGLVRPESHMNLARNASSASLEPRSYVKGFDTSAFDSRPKQGSIAPPPTPAPAAPCSLGPSPPSAMKSPPAAATTQPPPTAAKKKLFFISSPNSDSEEDASPPSHLRKQPTPPSKLALSSLSPKGAVSSRPPTSSTQPPPQEEEEEEWDDEDGSSDDDSSGWGSEYSTESEEGPRRNGKDKSTPLFAKRASGASSGELKPRGPGLLSQLFHPAMFEEEDRSKSAVDVTAASSAKSRTLQPSRSHGLLSSGNLARSKSFLRGAPEGVEMESSSEEDDGYEDEDEEAQQAEGNAMAAALARHQRQVFEQTTPIAPPQSPRTTRRAMLATELSESLRRNLLWERQTRNRVLGGPIDARFQPNLAPHQPLHTSETQPALRPPLPVFEGLRAPHPSPATRESSPIQPLPRRHTTGTGLYLAQQMSKGRAADSDSDSSDEEEEQPDANRYGSAFQSGGLHVHGW